MKELGIFLVDSLLKHHILYENVSINSSIFIKYSLANISHKCRAIFYKYMKVVLDE